MTNDFLTLSNVVQDLTRITVGNNNECTATYSGTLYLKVKQLPNVYAMKLEQVYFVPSFGKKIISVFQLTQQGYSLTFRQNFCDMLTGDHQKFTFCTQRDGMCYILGRSMPESKVMAVWDNNSADQI